MGLAFVLSVIGAIWCANVASTKRLSVLGYTLLGFLLPVIGVIIVMTAAPAVPSQARSR